MVTRLVYLLCLLQLLYCVIANDDKKEVKDFSDVAYCRKTCENESVVEIFSCISQCFELIPLTLTEVSCKIFEFSNDTITPKFSTLCHPDTVALQHTFWNLPYPQLVDMPKNFTTVMISFKSCEFISKHTIFKILTQPTIKDTTHPRVNLINICYNAKLSPAAYNKTTNGSRLHFITPQYFSYNTEYLLSVFTEDDTALVFAKKLPKTPTCRDVNPGNKCACETVFKLSEKLNFSLNAYQLQVFIPIVDPCYAILSYVVKVLIFKISTKTDIQTRQYSVYLDNDNVKTNNENASGVYTINISPFYELADGYDYKVTVLAIANDPVSKHYFENPFIFKAWKPSALTLVNSGQNQIMIIFSAADPIFNITSYLLVIDYLSEKPFPGSVKKTSRFYTGVVKKSGKSNTITTKFRCLKPGRYSVQFREKRSDEDEMAAFYNLPRWSKTKNIDVFGDLVDDCLEPLFSDNIVSFITVSVVMLTFFFIIFVFCFYMWKKGFCAVMKYRLPNSISKWLNLQTFDVANMQPCVVWLIWENDNRSPKLNQIHTENIRHFAAYLTTVCAIEVILDLFEEQQLIQDYPKWISTAYDRSDYIIFVCPTENTEVSHPPLLGNFNVAYRFLEAMITNRKRFITVRFPYSTVGSSPRDRWLKNTTMNYQLMDEIENLYFHLQETNRIYVNGKLSVKYVNKKEFIKTLEGQALQKGFDQFSNEMKMVLSDDNPSDQEKDHLIINLPQSSLSIDSHLPYVIPPAESQLLRFPLEVKPPCDDFD